MALQTSQNANLNALNQKIAGGYTASATDIANLAYAKTQGYSYTPMATGATKIASPLDLKGLTESQLYRSGQDIYKLPTTVTGGVVGGTTPAIPVINPISTVDSVKAGFDTSVKGAEANLATTMDPLPSEQKLTAIQDAQAKATGEQQTSQQTLQEQKWQENQLSQNVAQVQQIMPQIAKINAEYTSLQEQNANLPILSRIMGGTQDKILRQKAIELGGLAAVAQAYQGNVDLARNIAQDAVNAQYQDQKNYNDNLITQLDSVYKDLNREEKVKADSLKVVIDERNRQIEDEKAIKNDINKIMLDAAQNGADTSTISAIQKSKTVGDAIKASGTYIKTATGATWDTFTDESTGETKLVNKITGDVKNIGTASTNLGNPVGEIFGLSSYSTRTENPGVNRSDRNNNPGNIKVSDNTKNYAGVIGVESDQAGDGGNFLIFDTPESGIAAIGKLLMSYGYKGMTAEKAIKRYNGGGAYGATSVRLDPNKDFQSQLQDPNKLREVTNAMAIAEGFTGGTKTNTQQTRIDELATNYIKNGTKLTDIKGVNDRETAAIKEAYTRLVADQTVVPESVSAQKSNMVKSFTKNIEDIDAALNAPGFSSAVGPNALARKIFSNNLFTKNANDAAAKINSIVSSQALKVLIDSKAQGATFGALSDRELDVLSSANTTLNSFAKVVNGRVKAYVNSEENIINELNKLKTASMRLLVANGGNLPGEDGIKPKLAQFLIAFSEKKIDYDNITSANPSLTDDEIIQVLSSY